MSRRRLRLFATALLALYWLAMFIGTHLPKLPQVGGIGSDKTLHGVGYFGLALLLAWRWSFSARLGPWHYARMALILLAYASLDELLQIPMEHRNAEWSDWFADLVGVVAGLVVFATLASIFRSTRRDKITNVAN